MDRITDAVSSYVKSRGITIQAISSNTGISYNVLQPSFSGKRKLRADEFLEICEFLSVNPREFRQVRAPTVNEPSA